tara:strand:- start:179 stop:388 length:210 start_codon:yes stop_codon:yes gene_type:complete
MQAFPLRTQITDRAAMADLLPARRTSMATSSSHINIHYHIHIHRISIIRLTERRITILTVRSWEEGRHL